MWHKFYHTVRPQVSYAAEPLGFERRQDEKIPISTAVVASIAFWNRFHHYFFDCNIRAMTDRTNAATAIAVVIQPRKLLKNFSLAVLFR